MSLIQIAARGEPIAHPPSLFRFESSRGTHVLAVDGSRVYDIPADVAGELDTLIASGWFDTDAFGLHLTPQVPALRSLSLNLSQACNLGCGYCYADGGQFGGPAQTMAEETARRSIDLLLEGAPAGERVVVGFMGGEPLTQRALLHNVTRYAAEEGARRRVRVEFSLTTNGTLIREEDARLFSELDWTVQISMDGRREWHDRQRPAKNGRSAYEQTVNALAVMDRTGRPRVLTAKASVGRGWDYLPAELDHLIGLGFDDVGLSPVLTSPSSGMALGPSDLDRFLSEMKACGNIAVEHWRRGAKYPFANLAEALHNIHEGAHRPYPCGAGAAYLSVSADGDLYACHRFINDGRARMGDVLAGPDHFARSEFLRSRHADRQEPCRNCWARYLCGGGCHHEVLSRGRSSCDYIRGWLEYCLRTYVEFGEEWIRSCRTI